AGFASGDVDSATIAYRQLDRAGVTADLFGFRAHGLDRRPADLDRSAAVPGVSKASDATERRGRMPADPDWGPGLLYGLPLAGEPVDPEIPTVERHRRFLPAVLEELKRLVTALAATFERHAESGELFFQPSDACAEDRSPSG